MDGILSPGNYCNGGVILIVVVVDMICEREMYVYE